MKICSLLPSATEIVYSLGLGDSLVGVTHECDHPAEVAELPMVTSSRINHSGSSSLEIHHHVKEAIHRGTSIYSLNRELLEQLRPDLILTQELCDVCAVSYRLVKDAVRVLDGEQTILSLEPTCLDGILETIVEVGRAAKVEERARAVKKQLSERIEVVSARAEKLPRRRVFALEWIAPPFVGGHWVPEMIARAGGHDGLGVAGKPSFETDWERIVEYDPEVIVVMPCGFDLEASEEHLREQGALPPSWNRLRAVHAGGVYAVDGSSFFNRPGPRIVDGLEILAEILHPEHFPRRHDETCWRRID